MATGWDKLRRHKDAAVAVAIIAMLAGGVSIVVAASGLANGGRYEAASYGSTDLGPSWSHFTAPYGAGNINAGPQQPTGYGGTKPAAVIWGEGDTNTGAIVQTVALNPGSYCVTLSDWTWQYDGGTVNSASSVPGDLFAEASDYILGDAGWTYGSRDTNPPTAPANSGT